VAKRIAPIVALIAALSSGPACRTTDSEPGDGGFLVKDSPGPGGADGTGAVELQAVGLDGNFWTVTVPVDHGRAVLTTSTGIEQLVWDSNEASACECRTYANERYKVLVQFPFGSQEGSAVITDLTYNENGELPGTLVLASGESVSVGEVSVSDSREFISFDYAGNTETLELDSTAAKPSDCGECATFDNFVYVAVARWTTGGVKGRVDIKEKN
jgi:hypothetical protein